jgi:putative DNA modification/repair radical SAM protein
LETIEKIKILGREAQFDLSCSCSTGRREGKRKLSSSGRWIYPAVLPNGREIKLLKILMTNICMNDCAYCPISSIRDTRRITFTPEELAGFFSRLREKGYVSGLFLSSGIAGNPDRTMEKMIACAEILRYKYNFRGYIHLKILPGTSKDAIEKAVLLADRVSINLEAPNPRRLKRIAGRKDFSDILLRMKWIREIVEECKGARAGITTQFVVGAANETDGEILKTISSLYRDFKLERAYFSAFQPIRGTPLENLPPASPLREHRLYQADFLIRKYGFSIDEIPLDEKGNLFLNNDPKMEWARKHPEFFPIEINEAEREELLRVPGIGPVSAKRILKLRARKRITSIDNLKSIGVVVKRAAPFILVNGKYPLKGCTSQLSIF